MPEFITKHKGFILGLVLFVITLAAYIPAMVNGGFIWDDESYIINNKTLRDIPGLIAIWTDPQATPQYYPLVHTGFWIEYQLWGLDPTGYHVNNVLLHALGAILLWRVLKRLKIPGAWLAAALFAIHPVHVESVAWVTERKNVLSIVFYLGSALAFIKWAAAKETNAGNRQHFLSRFEPDKTGLPALPRSESDEGQTIQPSNHINHPGKAKRRTYICAFVLFVCALLSKTVTASLPAALLLVAWWKDGAEPLSAPEDDNKPPARLFKWIPPLIPFFTAGLFLSGLTVWLEKHHVGAKGVEWHLSFIDRCLVAGRALWFYIGKLLWPSKLIFNYTRWDIDTTVWWQYLFPLAFAALLVLFWLLRKRLGRGPLAVMLFFAGTLFPALGFLDVYPFLYSFVADHFQYHASIGVLVLIAAALTRLLTVGSNAAGSCPSKAKAGNFPWCPFRAAGVTLILVVLGTLSWRQCRIYQNLETLWFDTIDKNPISRMAYNNLGMLYLEQGRPGDAIPQFRRTLELYPNEMKAYSNLGAALSRLGRIEEAVATYQEAIDIDPEDPMAYNNLGATFAKQKQYDRAIPYYEKALALEPDFFATHINLGTILARQGLIEKALKHHKKALALNPDSATAHLNYGETLQIAGRIREASEQYRTALRFDPSLAVAHIHLGEIAVQDKLLPAALDHYHRAVELAPRLAEANNNLAKVLAATGKLEEAGEYFNRAIALKPDSGPIRLSYAAFLARVGYKNEARQAYLTAAKLIPDNPDPLFKAGVIAQQLGDTTAAEAQFRAVLKLAPNHAESCNYLAVLLAAKGKNTEAIDLLQRAVKQQPENAEFYNNLGVILVRAGKPAKALTALETAVRLNADYAEAKKNLADLKKLMAKSPEKP